ncbi:MAG TPA: amidohydrolase [Terriglobales bacterium]|jgi:predicted amidohydrolase YtcJ|nr:amidohydrolase [Terriglobales bacterium]
MRTILFVVFTMSIVQAQNQPVQPKADLILLHANIYTGVAVTSSFHEIKRAQAMAVRGERIEAVGEDADILKLKGPETQVIDLGGHFVMPGFNDAHVHLAEAGFERLTVDLTGVRSLSEFRERIRARVETAAPGEWIVGGGWDQTRWPVQELPSRWDVDEVTKEHPVLLQRVDGHIAVANTRALQLASITIASKNPEGGRIDRDSTGEPNGILRETAREAVFAVIPQPTHEKRREALEASLREAAQLGITSVQDNSDAEGPASWEDFQILEEIERDGKLTARISEWLPFNAPLDTLQAHRAAHSQSDNMLHTGMLKAFMDGSLGSRTAALLEPYADEPKDSGLPRYDQAKLLDMAKERAEAGFQLGFHAIGDKGVQMALDTFAAVEKDARERTVKAANGGTDYRLRIEHAQVTTPLQIAKFKELKVVASMQPGHVLSDMNWAEDRLGPKRAAHSYAWAEFQKRGVKLAFGSDYPFDQLSPFRGLYAAVTRTSEDGKKEYFPEQKLTMEQAIAAYTTGSAFAEFAEKEKGTLAPGMLADFIVLDRDITAVPPAKVLGTKVLRTVVGGKTVYEAK